MPACGNGGERFLTAFGMTTLGQGGEKQVPHYVPFEAQGKRDDNVKSADRAAQPSWTRKFCGCAVLAAGEGRAFCFCLWLFPACGRESIRYGDVRE